MLVFIGLILVYGLLFAILAVSKAILDKDKNRLLPPKALRKAAAKSQRIPLRPFQSSGVPQWTKMRGFSCKAAQSLPLRLQGVLPSLQSLARSFMTQTVNARTAKSERMTKPGAGNLEREREGLQCCNFSDGVLPLQTNTMPHSFGSREI